MKVTSLLLSSTHFLFALFHPQNMVQAEDAGEVEKEQFYCDDSPDALDFVPASRTCRNLAGQTRCWFTYIPEEDEQESVPLVLDLHGFTSCAAFNPTYTGWRELAADENFYVVWPQGTNNIFYSPIPCWNAGSCCCANFFNIPDSQLMNDIIERTIEESDGRIDPKRVYIVGHSNGCFMSQRFAKDYPGVVAGVACHAGVMLLNHPSEDDPDWIPTTIVTVHGDEDETVSYPTTPTDLGAEDNIDLWAESNGCTKKTVTPDSGGEYTTHTWTGCTGGVSTRLYQVIGGDHTPYGSDGWVDTTTLAWDYLKTVSLDPDCPGNQVYASIEVTTDENPSETSWSIARDTADNILYEEGDYTEQNFKYTFSTCATVPSCYIFTIYDSGGDGLSGDGGYKIYSNGNVVIEDTFESGFEKTVLIGCD